MSKQENSTGRIRLGVLFGGKSTEHEVSRVSAYSIICNLDPNRYEPVLIGITKNGDWLPYNGDPAKLPDGSWEAEAVAAANIPNLGSTPPALEAGVRVLRTCRVVLPVLHGVNGEDGTVQGLLELLDLPYVGCGVFASAAGMDKAFAKELFARAGIPQCRHLVFTRKRLTQDPDGCCADVAAQIGFPCFVKPANSGSSVGVSKVKTPAELPQALRSARKYDYKILVEEFVDGREIECAVLGNGDAAPSVPGEILPSKEFYDYEDKYQSGTSRTVIPAELPPEALQRVQELAVRAFRAIGGSGLSRVDFFYKKDGTVLLNEINTLPGFTEISMYSKLWIHAGMTYSELLDNLIQLAFLRKEETARCYHE